MITQEISQLLGSDEIKTGVITRIERGIAIVATQKGGQSFTASSGLRIGDQVRIENGQISKIKKGNVVFV